MDHSPFGQLPGEIRNAIYDHVFDSNEDTMEIKIDENGVAEDAMMKKLGLRVVCKQTYEETKHYGMTETKSFVLKPHCTTRSFGNATITALFDLDKCVDSIARYRAIKPERVVLCVGELDVAKTPDEIAWRYEMERIANRIPLEGLRRRELDFAVDLAVSAYSAGLQHITIPLKDVSEAEAFAASRAEVNAGIRELKRIAGSIMPEEWKPLGPREVARRRMQLYHDLHVAQHAIPNILMKVYYSLERIKKGKPRCATLEEADRYVGGWQWDD